MKPALKNLPNYLEVGLAFMLILGTAVAQSPGAFTTTGNLVTPRYFHTATLLLDGKVLLAGGGTTDSGLSPLASAELYDPVTRTFAATGSMSARRIFHTATLLPSGKVLIAGGGPNDGGGYSVASAELYDPAMGTFAATGDMTVERSFHTATLLNTGKVLIAGFMAGTELYDPATGTFAASGDMHEPACDTATLLPNGKVLITRSIIYDPATDLETFVRHAELYDPSTGKFAFTGDMTSFHAKPTATLLRNGKVLIAGGAIGDGDGPTERAEIYDPATGVFTATGSMTAQREDHTATLLTDGSVLFAGGHNIWYGASAEIYDPGKQSFSGIAGMPTAREYHRSTLLNDGRVLVSGGFEFWISQNLLSTAQLYTPSTLVPAPSLFTVSGNGQGQGAIWHAQTGQIASSQNPAVAGEVLSLYTTGMGDGSVVPPQVAIGGRLGEILFFGNAPRYPGFNQVNVRVPSGVAQGSAVPVRLTYLYRSSNEVTIGVR